MLAPPGRRRVGCGHSIRAAGVRLRDGIGRRKRSVIVEQPEQFQEEGTCDTLREDVGNHDGTASVAQRDDVASNLVAQFLIALEAQLAAELTTQLATQLASQLAAELATQLAAQLAA